MRVTIQVSAIAAAGALLLAACGSAAAPSSAPAAAPASSAAAKPASAPAASGSAAVKPSAAASGASSAAAKPAAAGSAPAVALPKPEVTSIKIGNASHEAHSYPPQYALDQGIYKKYGFTNVTTTYFDGDAKARQAILAGQIDIMS